MVYFLTHLPIKKFANIHALHDIAMTLADKMVKEKLYTYKHGLEGTKDLMSLLVRANAVEKEDNKLSDAEVNSEIMCVLLSSAVFV
jgi:cytochrome P450